MSNRNWSGYVVPPIFAFGLTVAKDIMLDGYLPDSPHVYIDAVVQSASYITAKLTTEMSMDAMFSDADFIQDGFDRVAEPTIQGLVSAILNGTFNFSVTGALAGLTSSPRLKAALPKSESFFKKFADGAAINISSTYLSEPLIGT